MLCVAHLRRQSGKACKALVGDNHCIRDAICCLGTRDHATVVLEHGHRDEFAADDYVVVAGVALSQKLDARVFPHGFRLAADDLKNCCRGESKIQRLGRE